MDESISNHEPRPVRAGIQRCLRSDHKTRARRTASVSNGSCGERFHSTRQRSFPGIRLDCVRTRRRLGLDLYRLNGTRSASLVWCVLDRRGLADVPPSISSGFRRYVLCRLSSARIFACRSHFPRSRSGSRTRSPRYGDVPFLAGAPCKSTEAVHCFFRSHARR